MARTERIAIAYCRLSAQEFGAMTIREVMWRIQADVERENRELERTAQLACWLINSRLQKGQRPLTVKKLIKTRPVRQE